MTALVMSSFILLPALWRQCIYLVGHCAALTVRDEEPAGSQDDQKCLAVGGRERLGDRGVGDQGDALRELSFS